MDRSTVFLTGATGFVGRRLLPELVKRGYTVCALRRAGSGAEPAAQPGVTWVSGSLSDVDSWAPHLEGCHAVLHLAACTGNAPAEEHRLTNAEGTRLLLEAAGRAQVPRFLFVSTIAARYPETKAYPYGHSKKQAEDFVRASDLAWTIVRPTIVVGPGAPGWKALAGLATLPFVPAFGGGRAKVQPVHQGEVVQLLIAALEDPSAIGEVIEVGGPEALTMGALLSRLRLARRAKSGGLLPLPVRPLIGVLAFLERCGLRLPATAGQFYVFRYDSDARPHPLVDALPTPRVGLEAMCQPDPDE